MAGSIVYFDLETQRTANDVGGWSNKHQMGMSIGVTYNAGQGVYNIYSEQMVNQLIAELRSASLVIGFNHVSFDYGVLGGYYAFDLAMELRSLDLMVDLEKELGHRPKLEDVAVATLGVGKTAEGLQAIRWWQQGKLAEIAEYCAYDVKVTKCVHEYGAQHGHVKYKDRNGREQQLAVNWTL
ncbi:RNase H superfamily protein [Roseimicrobium gellanilyticum]|uniref:RNase H superfamily protein n=1 Tax=Roseimicrobium gellanilyticum TaxID=748857 RepID=A0A366H8K8_9BACT|nr:ribonuclease H-like domain-containing protein [Roseimicrobium gellanilyticum]RBP38569.1 RNase H superfamily protein [Roseimicrobium gellanilyticum]